MVILAFVSVSMYAQSIVVTGKVIDSEGYEVIGGSVTLKGAPGVGTVTNVDGHYSLKVNDASKDVLVFSYVGMTSKEVKVNGRNVVNVTLEADAVMLDEVVTIGYATVKKKDLTGSVSSVNSKELAAVPISDVTQALSGKVAGVQVIRSQGSPDADVSIKVRGGTSITQSNEPLYIIDGFPSEDGLKGIESSDIESIDILKDASSTAIYGARGANGVIIITTKSGKEGKVQVDFGASFGVKQVTRLTKVLDPYNYVAYQNEIDMGKHGNYSDMDIWRSVDGFDYQDEMFGRTGNQQQYNINVSGGSKELQYSVSYAHNEEKSIMLNSGFKKDNINAKIKSELNKWLSLDFNARLSHTAVEGLGGGADTNESNAANSTVANSVIFRPIDPLQASTDDEENSTATQKTPLERLLATEKERGTFNQNYNVGINWKPFKGWTFRSEFGYGWKYDDTEQYWGVDAVSNSKYGNNGKPQAYLLREKTNSWRNANTLTYENKDLFDGRDRLNVLIGHEVSSSFKKSVENVSVAFPNTMNISEIKANMGTGTALPTQSTLGAKENMLSFFGRANYTLMDRYLLTFTLRGDGSSKFGKGNQWGLFPSAALAWRISDETFMESAKDWLSSLKLRLSFGTAGNNRINSGLLNTTYSLSGNDARYPLSETMAKYK